MASDLEIRITSKNLSGPGIDDASRKVKSLRNDFKDVEAASKIDAKVNVDDSEVGRTAADLNELGVKPITPKVDVDTSGVQDSVAAVEGQFAGVDLTDMGSSVTGQLSSLLAVGGPIGGIVAAAGAAFGDDLAAGFNRGFSANRNRLELEVRTGMSAIDLEPIGQAAGAAYSSGLGDGLADVRNTAILLRSELGSVDDNLDLTEATRQAQVMADVMGIDLPQSINLARRLVANDLVNDTDEAFNLMVDTAQRFQLSFDEIFEVASEFAPVFSKLGVDGAQAFHIIGETVRQGLLPNVDRAAELFEEFNVRVTDNSAEEAIDGIGLSMANVRNQVASGMGAEALADVAAALLEIGDTAQRDELAVQIFGTAIESAADPEAALQLLATADAVRDVGNAADEAVAKTEEMQTGFDKAQKVAEKLGTVFGKVADNELSEFFGDFERAQGLFGFGDDADKATKSVELMAAGFGGGSNHVRDLEAAFGDLDNNLGDVEGSLSDVSAAEQAAADAADILETSLRSLSDWAEQSGEAALRSVWAAAGDLTEAFIENTAAAFDARNGWDLTSEAGRNGSEVVEGLRGDVARLTDEFLNGQVGPSEYRAALRGLEESIDDAGRAAGLSSGEIAELKDLILGLPAETQVLVDAETTSARIAVSQLTGSLDALNNKTVETFVNNNINTYYRQYGTQPTPGRAQRSGGVTGSAQTGGIREGFTLVGEEGPELVDLAPGSQVFSTPDTNRMIGTGGGGGGGMSVVVNVAGSVLSERDLVAVVREELMRGGLADAFSGAGAAL